MKRFIPAICVRSYNGPQNRSQRAFCLVAGIPNALAVLRKVPVYKAFRGKIKRYGNRHIVSITVSVMVAGEGFEPTTSGLSLRAALPHLPFPGRAFAPGPPMARLRKKRGCCFRPRRRSPAFPNELRSSVHNPETLGPHSPESENLSPPNGGLRFLVAGEGFEPTTSGL